jgi:hypothetical protein
VADVAEQSGVPKRLLYEAAIHPAAPAPAP